MSYHARCVLLKACRGTNDGPDAAAAGTALLGARACTCCPVVHCTGLRCPERRSASIAARRYPGLRADFSVSAAAAPRG